MSWKSCPLIPCVRWMTSIAIVAVLSSCSAQWHLRQAIRKDPSIVKESVTKYDTIVITKSHTLTDTLTLFKDTTIFQDRVQVKVKWLEKEVFLEAICPPDTLTITKEVKVSQIKHNDLKTRIWDGLWFGLLGMMLVYLVKDLAKMLRDK